MLYNKEYANSRLKKQQTGILPVIVIEYSGRFPDLVSLDTPTFYLFNSKETIEDMPRVLELMLERTSITEVIGLISRVYRTSARTLLIVRLIEKSYRNCPAYKTTNAVLEVGLPAEQ